MTAAETTAPSRSDAAAAADATPRWRLALLLGTSVLLGVLFLVHPDGSGGLDSLLPVADLWLSLHVAMLPLLGLLGVSFYVLLAEHDGTLATVGRVGVAVYATFYVAFEAIAGVASGLLATGAGPLAPAQQAGVATAYEQFLVPSVTLGLIGSLGAIVAVVAAGVCLRRAGAPVVPVVLLGGAPLATVFHGGTPLDAFGMAAYLVGVAWLELGYSGDATAASVRSAEAGP